MKKLIMLAAIVAASFAANANSTGATTNWVARFVADYVGKAISNSTAQISAEASSTTSTGGVKTVKMNADGFEFLLTFEPLDQPALVAQSVTPEGSSYGITNGFTWAWSEQVERYVNVNTSPIIPTQTNFVWNGVGTIMDGSKTWVLNGGGSRLFELLFSKIQLSTAKNLKGEN